MFFRIFITIIAIFSFNVKNIYAKINIFLEINKPNKKIDLKLNQSDEFVLNIIKNNIRLKEFDSALTMKNKILNKEYKNITEIYIFAEAFKQLNILNYKNFINLLRFNQEYSFLSTFNDFNYKIEKYYLNNDVKYEDIKEYFNKHNSKNIDVNIKLFKQRESYIYENFTKSELLEQKKFYIESIQKFFINNNFTNSDLGLFIDTFSYILTEEDVIEKIKILLFKQEIMKNLNIAKYLKNEDYKILFNGIIEIKRYPKNINSVIRNIPKHLKEDELLLYTKLIYFRRYDDDNFKEILNIFYSLKNNSKYPQFWWRYRQIYARELLKENEYKKAYYIIATHNLKKGDNNFVDAEWFAGWLVLRYLGRADIALEHFENFSNNVTYPISSSRGYYWLGRTYIEQKNKDKAIKMFKKATTFGLNFYGQIANIELNKLENNKDDNFNFPIVPTVEKKDIENLKDNKAFYLGYFYHFYLNEEEKAFDLMKIAIEQAKTKGEIVEIINISRDFDNLNYTFQLAKTASYREVYYIEYLYPILNLISKENQTLNLPLVHAISRQESAFKITAKSRVGALGFMQIMPKTAKLLCKELGIKYNEYNLIRNPQYNILLGNYYINSLIDQFDGSKILAIASYNAGPHNAKRWLKEFGDVRTFNDIYKIVDWLESITYSETRNYVQRVLENLVVYEFLLQNNMTNELN